MADRAPGHFAILKQELRKGDQFAILCIYYLAASNIAELSRQTGR
jgi:hypothetical protein